MLETIIQINTSLILIHTNFDSDSLHKIKGTVWQKIEKGPE